MKTIQQLEAENAELRAQLLRVEQERGRLVDQAPATIAVLEGPQHVVTHLNLLAFELFGRRELTGKPHTEALPELVGPEMSEVLDQVYATGEPFEAHRYRRADSSYALVTDRGYCVFDDQRKAVRMVGAMHGTSALDPFRPGNKPEGKP